MTTKICLGAVVKDKSLLKKLFNKNLFLTFLVFILSSCYVFSKDGQDDLYLKATEAEIDDLGRLSKLHFQENDLLLAEEYAKLQLEQAEYNQYLKGRAEAFKILGVVKIRKNNSFQALEQLKKSLFLYEKLQDETNIANLNNNIGIVYTKIELYKEAIDYQTKSIVLFRKIKDFSKLADVYRNIGMCYAKLENSSQALEFYENSLTLLKELNQKEATMAIYEDIAIAKRKLGLYKEALNHYNELATYHEKNKNIYSLMYVYNNLGYIYQLQKDYPKAIKTLEKALTFAKEQNTKEQIVYKINNNLGEIYLTQKDYPKALAYFQANETLNINPEDRELTFTYENIANIYQILQDEQQAKHYQNKKITLENHLNQRITSFQKIRQQQLDFVEKEIKNFKSQNASFLINFDNPLELALFALIAVIAMAIIHYFEPIKQFTFAGLGIGSQNSPQITVRHIKEEDKPTQTSFVGLKSANYTAANDDVLVEEPTPKQPQILLPTFQPMLPKYTKPAPIEYKDKIDPIPPTLPKQLKAPVKEAELLNTDIDSPYLIEIQRQKGKAYYLDHCWGIRMCDGFKPLHPSDPYFPHYLPLEEQAKLVLQLAQLAVWKKNLALYTFEEGKQNLEKTYQISIDKSIGIFSYYANWLIEKGFYTDHGQIVGKMDTSSDANSLTEETFTHWMRAIALKTPESAEQAHLCRTAISKDLFRQGDDLAFFEKSKGKAYVTSLDHPTAYTKPLFDAYKNAQVPEATSPRYLTLLNLKFPEAQVRKFIQDKVPTPQIILEYILPPIFEKHLILKAFPAKDQIADILEILGEIGFCNAMGFYCTSHLLEDKLKETYQIQVKAPFEVFSTFTVPHEQYTHNKGYNFLDNQTAQKLLREGREAKFNAWVEAEVDKNAELKASLENYLTEIKKYKDKRDLSTFLPLHQRLFTIYRFATEL